MDHSDGGHAWQEVLEFWFPEGRSGRLELAAHKHHWFWRMQGGADAGITGRYSGLTAEAAAGKRDRWASDPEGRLALIVVLDQFSRSVWRDSARAFAQDPAALALVLEGLSNGHYAALSTPWFKIVYGLPLGHCEGADHLERLDFLIELRQELALQAPAHLRPVYQALVGQARAVRAVIAAFGRHPHRNRLLGRPSTPDEEIYVAKSQFPHLQAFRD